MPYFPGSYHTTYANALGQLGQVPSSRRFKTDIEAADLDWNLLRRLRLVTYRYIAAVEAMGDDAPTEIGLIAEEVDDLGLSWLVTYDAEGRPEGINDRALTYVALEAALRSMPA